MIKQDGIRWIQRFKNFIKAFSQLKEAVVNCQLSIVNREGRGVDGHDQKPQSDHAHLR